MYIESFVNITSRAWALPILSSLHAGVPGRQAPLMTATGASRTAFAQSMEHLIELGLVERNPGHGHPLRPEFRLTALGANPASLAAQVQRVVTVQDQDLLRKSWTLPVLSSLQSAHRFNDIKRSLQTITDRALSQSLKTLETRDWVQRRVDDTARPPRSLYSPINTGERISQIVGSHVSFRPS